MFAYRTRGSQQFSKKVSLKFDALTAVVMKNCIFWDMTQYVATIFRVEEYVKGKTSMKHVSASSILKLDVTNSSETSNDFQLTTK
jgi:hypothetical protein